jgi:zinc transport system substrate-binding protein
MMKKAIVILGAFLLCCGNAESEGGKAVKVFASNYPLSYFATRISGDPKIVNFPEMDGDPAFWEPTTDAIVTVQQSDVILLNGATYEKWRTSVSLPKGKIVDSSKAFQKRYILMEEAVDHAHGPTGAHSHSGTAFTTWIDLNQAAFQANAVRDALAKKKVASEEVLNENFDALIKDLKHLDTKINETTKGQSAVPLLASHPVYQYFARRYGLNIRAVMWEPDVLPDEKLWTELGEIIKEHPAKWMIWEGRAMPKSAAKLKEMGIGSIVFDPCGNRPESGDFLSVMNENVKNLKKIFGN